LNFQRDKIEEILIFNIKFTLFIGKNDISYIYHGNIKLILKCFFSVYVFLYVGTCICMWACWRQIIWQTGEKQEKDAFRVREDEPNSGSVVSTDWQLQFTCQHQKRFRFVSFRFVLLNCIEIRC